MRLPAVHGTFCGHGDWVHVAIEFDGDHDCTNSREKAGLMAFVYSGRASRTWATPLRPSLIRRHWHHLTATGPAAPARRGTRSRARNGGRPLSISFASLARPISGHAGLASRREAGGAQMNEGPSAGADGPGRLRSRGVWNS